MQAASSTTLGPRTIPFGEFLAALIHSLGEEGVGLHVLRNYDGFPVSNNSRDLDLLIPRADLPRAIRAIRSIQGVRIVGYAERHYVASVLLAGVSGAPEARALQVDFYLVLTWKGIPYLQIDRVLKAAMRRQAGELNFFVPHPVHEAIISLFAGLLLGGTLKEKYFPQAQRTFAAARLEAVDALQPQFGLKVATRLVDSVIDGDRPRVIACIRPLRAALALRSLRTPLRSARNIVRHYALEFKARCTPADLETVCILGPSGCGATAIIEGLMPILQSSSVLVEKRDSGPRLPPLVQSREIRLSAQTRAEPQDNSLTSSLSILRWLVEEWQSQFVGKSLPTLRVCESACYELLADPGGSHFSGPKWVLRLVGKLLPPAELWIFLEPFTESTQLIGQTVSPSHAHNRFAAYRSFLKTRKKYVILDAGKPSAVVTEEAYAAIIDALAERADKQLKSRLK
jgi:PHD/YefM family antitoxin component YafN of YafNO toxin-antitoxin module